MPLPAGTKLRWYEIVGALGAGGMGEVYRARDAKLNRDVAIKVLPEAACRRTRPRSRASSARRRRSPRSSHPNILAIHDFGTHGEASRLRGHGAARGRDAARAARREGALPAAQGGRLRRRRSCAASPPRTRRASSTATSSPRTSSSPSDGRGEDPRLRPRQESTDTASRRGRGRDAAAPTAPTPGTVLGTVGYMSPEQVRGSAGRPSHRHLHLRRHPLRDADGAAARSAATRRSRR